MIELRNIVTEFTPARGGDPVRAVDDVSLHVTAGRIHGIIGFSGAGKSTLLRNINLLERPQHGSVRVNGTELTTLDPAHLRRARHQIGMVFQGFNLVNNLTAAQNVELALRFAEVKDAGERRRRAREALEVVGLSERATAYPAQLSGGQKQRVAIARAISTRPTVLLCDEPTSALDPFTTASVLQHLADVNREFGITVVIVTHEMEVIRALTHDVSVMTRGKIVERFATADLRAGTYQATTDIGRYLNSSGIELDRGATPTRELPTREQVAA
ncbi:MAG: ATP-binding cassette domain-containing protein [Micrococcus sp.]|nr:ATP-binding cassette domain-containing protein [Micrococcus sp.]